MGLVSHIGRPCRRTALAGLLLMTLASLGQAALIEDTYTRPDSSGLGITEVGGYAYTESSMADSITNVAAIAGQQLHIHGYSASGPASTSNHGQAGLLAPDLTDTVHLPNVDISADMRFLLSNTTGSNTTNNCGFVFRKPAATANVYTPGQVEVYILPTGGVMLREKVGGTFYNRYRDNPFVAGDQSATLNVFQAAGSLPTTFNGQPFDADGDGRLEADEPFHVQAVLVGNRLTFYINGQAVAAGRTTSDGSATGAQTLSLCKNRYTSAASTYADPYFDNLSIDVPDYIIRHTDDNYPLNEGWIEQKSGPNVSVGPIIETIGGKPYEAWSVDDNSGGRWHYETSLTEAEKALARDIGWKYTMLARLVDTNDPVDFSCHYEVTFDGTTYAMSMGTDAQGNPLVNLYGVGESWGQNPHAIAGTGYHWYEMLFDPGALGGQGAVSLYVDGDLLESDFPGRPSYTPTANRITWGSNHTAASGECHYAFVQLSILPEPTTLSLLGLGALALARARRRRR